VVLRTNTGGRSSTGEESGNVSLTNLRRYAGEIYSMAWDAALGLDEKENGAGDGSDGKAGPLTKGGKLLDLIVYPQNMPNTPPEGWIDIRPDLSCICSHDSITGWVTASDYAGGSGRKYASKSGQGMGGLVAHVKAVNAERAVKGLKPAVALHVDDWPDGADIAGDPNVVFLEDEDAYEKIERGSKFGRDSSELNGDGMSSLIGGSPIPPSSLYYSVAVGGTFDGMHYGHRKLLTLAISSVQPINGRLLIGITRDEMLTHKAFAERIPPLEKRIEGVLDFIGNLAPGMKNRIRCIPISDEYGPPGQRGDSAIYPGVKNDFDALVLSHETLPTGRKLNDYRVNELGLKPLKLLCTQRTEPHGMSSTALRRMRSSY
jgi:cytidyltransferase-like protein